MPDNRIPTNQSQIEINTSIQALNTQITALNALIADLGLVSITPISQADYDNLSPTDKLNGVFDIYDAVEPDIDVNKINGIKYGQKNTINPLVYTSWSTYGGCYYRKNDIGEVELNISLSGASGASSAEIGTLPSGYRPPHSIGSSALSVGADVKAGGLYIDDLGVIRVTSPNAYFIGKAVFSTY